MKQAIALAQKGLGYVSPNPLVGAVIVKDGIIIGQGFHKKYGGLHAERNALASCKENPKGATMYVTLEPCCHYGKTPPCTEAIISSGIAKVYVGMLDPNPLVAGKGVAILENKSIEVEVGLLEDQCRRQNEVFLHYVKTGKPFVAMKYAMTLDGKIATVTGKSQWITNDKSREYVHCLRHKYKAIMVGIGTVKADNPRLDCRIENGVNPIRIICDSKLAIDLDSNIVKTASQIKTIIATCSDDQNRHRRLLDKGCEIMVVPGDTGKVDLEKLMENLGAMKIDSILLEGGSELNFAALNSKIVTKIHAFVASKIFGGATAKGPVGGGGFEEVDSGIVFKNSRIKTFDEDYLIESEVEYSCLPD